MTLAPKTPLGVEPCAMAAHRYSAKPDTPHRSDQPDSSPRQKYSSGRPATSVPASSPHSSEVPVRGVPHTR
jgi:hypothetical protein